MNLIRSGTLFAFFILFSTKALAFGCKVDGGQEIGSGNHNIYVTLGPDVQIGRNLIVDLSQHLSCYNSYDNYSDIDHVNLEPGTRLTGPLNRFTGSIYWNGSTYPLPLNTTTSVLHIAEPYPQPMPMKLYLTPLNSAANGVLVQAGSAIAQIKMYKIADLNGGDPRFFTWNIISNTDIVIPIGGCNVNNRNAVVNLPTYPAEAAIDLNIHCAQNRNISFSLSGQTANDGMTFVNTLSSDNSASKGMGVQITRNGTAIPINKLVRMGIVGNNPVSLGLRARYERTGGQVTAGKITSLVGVTFTYD
ncbi:fimbrial protein [Proteus myxofaciens]|uniref:Mannose-specific adhesin n=1 Tax=Proteus myxofaciens ATCC 19692 TaxID=1354337 RepID=A0A198GHY6_9GAMM|nr:fimbrial protein [Proteus myxofaciens]OAT36723.1 mannose-specific adhesin [Proteus myxofaciens ATCC 19692]